MENGMRTDNRKKMCINLVSVSAEGEWREVERNYFSNQNSRLDLHGNHNYHIFIMQSLQSFVTVKANLNTHFSVFTCVIPCNKYTFNYFFLFLQSFTIHLKIQQLNKSLIFLAQRFANDDWNKNSFEHSKLQFNYSSVYFMTPLSLLLFKMEMKFIHVRIVLRYRNTANEFVHKSVCAAYTIETKRSKTMKFTF